MTNGENQAMAVINKYVPKGVTTEMMVKKLGEELVELAIAIERKDERNIREEIGDCAFILLHILSKHDADNEGIINRIVSAAQKMETRITSNDQFTTSSKTRA
jgi:phosphoribosyl-ATP pyrophosphohydrolase